VIVVQAHSFHATVLRPKVLVPMSVDEIEPVHGCVSVHLLGELCRENEANLRADTARFGIWPGNPGSLGRLVIERLERLRFALWVEQLRGPSKRAEERAATHRFLE